MEGGKRVDAEEDYFREKKLAKTQRRKESHIQGLGVPRRGFDKIMHGTKWLKKKKKKRRPCKKKAKACFKSSASLIQKSKLQKAT